MNSSVKEWLNTIGLGGAGNGEACWIAKTRERCQAIEPLQFTRRCRRPVPLCRISRCDPGSPATRNTRPTGPVVDLALAVSISTLLTEHSVKLVTLTAPATTWV